MRKPDAMLGWLRAYAAATSTTAGYTSVLDAATAGVSDKPARSTTAAYRDVLTQLWLLDPVPAGGTGNPLARLAQSPKHRLADPALAARLLGLSVDALLSGDGKPIGPQTGGMLGHLFESLATLCLRVAAQAAETTVGHLRTRNGDHEIDLVLVRDDGKVVAVEVKLYPQQSAIAISRTCAGWRTASASTCSTPSSSIPGRTLTVGPTA